MKRTNLFLVSLMMMLGVAFTACSDDEGGDGEKGGLFEKKVVESNEYDEWSYFNFENGEVQKLPVVKKEGGVTGMYTGMLKGVGAFSSVSMENQALLVNRISADSVEIYVPDVVMPSMSGSYDTISLKTRAKAVLNGKVWTLTGTATENAIEKNGNITIYKLTVDGTIGTAKGDDVLLDCKLRPGGMPMDILAKYTAKVKDSYIYEVNPEEEAKLDWDIAVHKYDIRTNGGLVKKINATELNDVTLKDVPSDAEMVADEFKSVIVDLSNMQSGFVGFQDVRVNKELGDWIIATPTGKMPPFTYALNKDVVFLVKVKGKVWKMKFTAYTYGGKTAATFCYGEVK